MERIRTCELHFTDEHGRLRFFNGMNIDDKQIGDVFRYPLDRAFFENYAAKGFNLIRLAVTWANLEPQMGVYSESYLRSLDEIFRLAEEFGVYILLDMHQDLYSGFDGVGGGDGAPAWACLTDGKRPRDYRFVWAEAYFFGPWVHNCFDHFWNNDPVGGRGLQDRYADLWQMLARRYGESEALFGFDFLNEPAPGTYTKTLLAHLLGSAALQFAFSRKIKRRVLLPALLKGDMKTVLENLPGAFVEDITQKLAKAEARFDRNSYQPFLNKMAAAVRAVTPNGILMMEQPYLCNTGVRLSLQPITVNGQREENQCFGPHAYDFTVDTPLYQYANADRVKTFFNETLSICERRPCENLFQRNAALSAAAQCSDNRRRMGRLQQQQGHLLVPARERAARLFRFQRVGPALLGFPRRRSGRAADGDALSHGSRGGGRHVSALFPQRRQNELYAALSGRRKKRNADLCAQGVCS